MSVVGLDMRILIALLLFTVAASAALDQSYVQSFEQNGSSNITKTMGVNVLSNLMAPNALQNMQKVCQSDPSMMCSVDTGNKTVTMEESLQPGGYYTYSVDYGFPFIIYTIEIDKVPTDLFANDFGNLLNAANATSSAGGVSGPIDLTDQAADAQNAAVLRELNANINYTIIIPLNVDYAAAGNASATVSGSTAQFDLLSVMEASSPMVVRSRELNWTYIVALIGLIALAALALAYFLPKKRKV